MVILKRLASGILSTRGATNDSELTSSVEKGER